MSSASPLHYILAAMADDPYWASNIGRPQREGGVRAGAAKAAPANITLFALQQDHHRNMADFVAQHGTPGAHADGSVYAAAGIIAAADPAAADEKAVIEEADRLRACIAIGEGLTAIGAVTCPACECFSLVPAHTFQGWRATCARYQCNPAENSRTWSLRDIAGHHLRATRAA